MNAARKHGTKVSCIMPTCSSVLRFLPRWTQMLNRVCRNDRHQRLKRFCSYPRLDLTSLRNWPSPLQILAECSCSNWGIIYFRPHLVANLNWFLLFFFFNFLEIDFWEFWCNTKKWEFIYRMKMLRLDFCLIWGGGVGKDKSAMFLVSVGEGVLH